MIIYTLASPYSNCFPRKIDTPIFQNDIVFNEIGIRKLLCRIRISLQADCKPNIKSLSMKEP